MRTDKPRLAVMPGKTSSRKWRCASIRPDGVEVVGTGYSLTEAYGKWHRNWANPWNVPRKPSSKPT